MATAVKTTEEKRYIEAVGRRKNAVARVRITESSRAAMTINEKAVVAYFPTKELQMIAQSPFQKSEMPTKFKVTAHITGGGVHAQAEALRHGITRAIIVFDESLRKVLKKEGFLKRDPRVKERKKFGLKKARRAPQWSKR